MKSSHVRKPRPESGLDCRMCTDFAHERWPQNPQPWMQVGNLIAASIYDKYSVGPSIRPICTRCCFTITNMIQVCSNFHWSRVFPSIYQKHSSRCDLDADGRDLNPNSPSPGESKPSHSIVMICTTICRIPASGSTNQRPDTGDFIRTSIHDR